MQKKKKDRNWKKKIAKDLVVQKDGVKLCNFASDSIWFRQSLWPYRFGILGQKAGQVSGPSLAHSDPLNPDPRPLTSQICVSNFRALRLLVLWDMLHCGFGATS